MKVTRVLFGIGVGLASGIAVSWMNRDHKDIMLMPLDKKFLLVLAQIEREIETIKRSFYNIIDYSKQVKNDVYNKVATLLTNLRL